MSHGRASLRPNSKRKRASDGNRTLGMVWGANSVSSSKSKGSAAFKDFGSYMSEKERKLRLQFQSEAENSLPNDAITDLPSTSENVSGTGNSNGLFGGISIFVDGFTIPSNQELRNYMIRYGGRYENYFSRERVTHIICSNLPNSKIKNLRSFSRGLPVVKPQWIVDCIGANKILHVGPYQLECLANECPQQQRLSTFFSVKSNSLTESNIGTEFKVVSTCSGPESSLNGETSERKNDCYSKSQEEILQESHTVSTSAQNILAKGANLNEENVQILNHEFQIPCLLNLKEYDISNHGDACGENEISEYDIFRSENNEDISNSMEATESRLSITKYRSHSTLEDANFVENYFKNSRLHFIGTWRNRYRKRFAGKSSEEIQGQYTGVDSSSNTTSVADSRVIIHVDMDCFFVSVVIRKHPELNDKPVAVCHSDNPKGTAEISSANYPARGHGIRAGMFVRDAKALCPHLCILPYDFSAYEEVADHLYDILHKHCNRVQALSCDEAYLDVTGLHDPDHIALAIRQEIFDVTKCTASAGIAGNLLLSRMATKRAKPNGQFHIRSKEVNEFLAYLPISELPGVGPTLQEKLNNQNVHNCSQLRSISKDVLQRDFGSKTGDMLWHYSRGIDHRQVQSAMEHKSIGAEVNWGVRFNNSEDVHHFLMKLCNEVSLRLQGACMRGRMITLKVKKRKKGAGEPAKYMGCGICDNISHSVTVPSATDSTDVLLRISRQLFASFHLDVKEVRGIGLQVLKLEAVESCHQGSGKNVLKSWLASMSKTPNSCELVSISNEENGAAVCNLLQKNQLLLDMKDSNLMRDNGSGKGLQNAERYDAKVKWKGKSLEGGPLPHISQLDPTVLACLPQEILSEINDFYNGKVLDYISGNGKVSERYSVPNMDVAYRQSTGTGSTSRHLGDSVLEEHKRKNTEGDLKTMDCDKRQKTELKDHEELAQDVVASTTYSVDVPTPSQLDPSVLLALPLSLRLEIQQHYSATNAVKKKNSPVNVQRKETSSRSQFSVSNPGKGIHKKVLGKASSSNSHNPEFMGKSIDIVDRQTSNDDAVSLSLSQVDIKILQELPTDIQRYIKDSLPAHRPVVAPHENALPCKREDYDILNIEINEPTNSCVKVGLKGDTCCERSFCKGNPPEWVNDFRLSSCVLLQLISECYCKDDCSKSLSSLLLCLISSLPEEFVSCTDIKEQSVTKCSDLLKQYIREKVKYDIEEVHFCVRLLKRLNVKSEFWLAIYNTIIPTLQANVGETYGGNLKL
ncbi:DNA repair protein REV1 isoform X2 [Cryptomeria japonica]|uniref:DNA repair protein REV1 isoform X2 n=1 Tax=Cryptomeria japonica TaxID=3369 RepID=UPI0027D9FF9D|nr:DNA repair protein REV1 isoform X2 [Cryptomeria japonica]